MQSGAMQVEAFTDARAFARAAGPAIALDPAGCNVIATQAQRAIDIIATQAQRAIDVRARDDDYLYLLFRDGDRPVGVAMHTPPFNLFVGPVAPADVDGTVRALVKKLAGRSLPGVTGSSELASAVAAAWAARTGRGWTLRMDEVLYGIEAAPAGPSVPGAVREAGRADRPWLNRWLADFHAEAVPYEPLPDPSRPATRGVRDRTMLLWVTGSGQAELPVSVAGVTLPQLGVSRIGPVYTPKPFRGHGYAGALTAAGTSRAFTTGAERVVLYADKANPTSNGVYRRLGYRPIGDAALIQFD